jgi:hypothetical protein
VTTIAVRLPDLAAVPGTNRGIVSSLDRSLVGVVETFVFLRKAFIRRTDLDEVPTSKQITLTSGWVLKPSGDPKKSGHPDVNSLASLQG